jgi:diguanylate cyclase (GGDEF)-like protein
MIEKSFGNADSDGHHSGQGRIYQLHLLAAAELREHITRLESAINNMSEGLVMFDAAERVVVCNEFYIEMYGLSRNVVKPGCLLIDLLRHRVETGGNLNLDPEQYRVELLRRLAQGQVASLIVKTAQGREVVVKNTPMVLGGWVATHEDITERRRAEAQIAQLAHYDALTELCNRSRFQEELQQVETRVKRGECFALFCLDLDRFKEVNDSLGHPVGDLLLKAVASRLRDCVRESDVVARLGGDEFAILQIGACLPNEATALASRLVESISIPYELMNHQVTVGVSVGIALAPNDAVDPDALLRNADMALYRAKAEGRNLYRFFEAEMDARVQARRGLEIDLRNAIVAGEFELLYQPTIDLRTRKISGFEALLRWRSPARGLLVPADFISLAEETGLIVPLGNWVIRQAFMDAVGWPGEMNIAVNLSSAQFMNKHLIPTVMSALAASGLSASRLELEITESVLLQDAETTLAGLQKLRGMGVRIVVDDFGSGYFSLSHLRKFRFDKIKIDQSFIRDMSDNDVSLAIVRAVVAMCSSLSIGTVAEGVETNEQLERLKNEGCTEAQGYLFSPPKSVTDVKTWLAAIASAAEDGKPLSRFDGE